MDSKPTPVVSGPPTGPHGRRKKKYVKPELQSKYAVVFVLLAIFGVVVGYALDTLHPILFGSQLLTYRLIAFAMVVAMFGGIIYFSLFFTHKIAGPLYRLEKFLRETADDKVLGRTLKFRSGDELGDVAVVVNEFLNALREDLDCTQGRMDQAVARLDALIAAASAEGAPAELRARAPELSQIRQLLQYARLPYHLQPPVSVPTPPTAAGVTAGGAGPTGGDRR